MNSVRNGFGKVVISSVDYKEFSQRVNDAVKRGQLLQEIGINKDRNSGKYNHYYAIMRIAVPPKGSVSLGATF